MSKSCFFFSRFSKQNGEEEEQKWVMGIDTPRRDDVDVRKGGRLEQRGASSMG